jgi:poly(3-hydroxybutyrate) depolymerase
MNLMLAMALMPVSADEVIREALIVGTPSNARSLLRTDPIEQRIVTGDFSTPQAGDKVGSRTWEKISAGADGAFQSPALRSGYVFATVQSPVKRVMLLEARGPSVSYVNGEPRSGDPYSFGYVSLPVLLNAGSNSLLFACSRGAFSARLVTPRAPVTLDARDATLPDITPAVKGNLDGALVVTNATETTLTNLRIKAEGPSGSREVAVGPIGPMTTRKVRFQTTGRDEKIQLALTSGGKTLDSLAINLRRRKAGETYKRTFVSAIDDSVQYYGVNPAPSARPGQAMFLSLHGASVEAIGQADAYAPKSWGTLVAPTNRRPYGFDWEDVGRRDALEVLAHAQSEYRPDPQRIYLTGHSMGGHGTWQVGVQYPDRFAAIAPSAGWISFWTYAGGGKYDAVLPAEAMLRRASNASDTLGLKGNYWQQAIYIVHGDADDNVPVTEARTMRKELEGHPALAWHEQPGAGHWWSVGDEPGARCVDWPGVFDTFARRRIPLASEVREISFTTANPGVSARDQWVTISQQEHSWALSSVKLAADHFRREFRGTTSNVAHLTLRTDALATGPDVAFTLDDTPTFKAKWAAEIHLAKMGGKWTVATAVPADEKNPDRAGGFKDVYRHGVQFVYGTAGTPAENAWAYAKARYDAETFWYRGNSGVAVMSDRDFLKQKGSDRNVILYGNADTNAAWSGLLAKAPVSVRRGAYSVGGKTVTGDDSAVLFIYPRPGSKVASVAAVSGTGVTGMRLTDRSPFFTAGASLPDLVAFTPRMLAEGSKGIRVAGFFGNRWDAETGDWAWND